MCWDTKSVSSTRACFGYDKNDISSIMEKRRFQLIKGTEIIHLEEITTNEFTSTENLQL